MQENRGDFVKQPRCGDTTSPGYMLTNLAPNNDTPHNSQNILQLWETAANILICRCRNGYSMVSSYTIVV